MHKKRNKIIIAVITVTSLIILGVLGYIVYKTVSENNEKTNLSNLASSYAAGIAETTGTADAESSGEDAADSVETPSIDVATVENPIEFDSLTSQNDDIYSWIYIPNTEINYPVLQSSSDDNFYLDHDAYQNYSFSGSIYSQSCNSKDYSDRVTVLYGHNMANGSMFAALHNFYSSSFFEENKYIYIYTPTNKLTYEIVSAFEYDNRHIMNSFDFSDDEVFSDYLEMIENPRSLSVNKRDVELTVDDKILVLSTCVDSGDGRFLVQGVLVKNEPTN